MQHLYLCGDFRLTPSPAALLVQESDGFSSSSSGWWTWSNAHMDPTPPAERTWGWINYFFLWWSYGFSTVCRAVHQPVGLQLGS